ncbi:2OG-Fe(II) oxygenase [Denitrobaculum tricleocarpae]|uniref:Proline hydroxylase n=1 Tax=Denitrobaculum tricleocarpae TaxID=2591009 RepID=A0A545T3W5_9PROT|nr:2OG-Fe(II) oxygenase [Denitrobaculum tricleocarpae]TQV71913.1 proline hydroxylase [Denitrobaculum tricleocarpae]
MTDSAQSSRSRSADLACAGTIEARVAGFDWDRLYDELDERGYALPGKLLSPQECERLVGDYDRESIYRSRVVMKRHNFGLGEYRYFSYPLPGLIEGLRAAAYPFLAPLANRWAARMKQNLRYPEDLGSFLADCHAQGQERPTPLILKYAAGDYNCLHQDLYGATSFPLQLAVLLNEPGRDFEGGEFILTEQRPRMQSRAEVVPIKRGEAVIFCVNERPVQGARGDYRVKMRHGVSRIRHGNRHTLGMIFHDAS